jgi:hypothetical protein
MNRKRAAVALATVLATGAIPAGLAVTSAGPAQAVTGGCLNMPRPEYGAVGCGALYLPGVSYPHAGTVLTLSSEYDSPWSPVVVKPMNGGASQDWTFYRVCTALSGDRSPASPCGSAGQPEPGKYVLEFTPFGNLPGGGVNSQASWCLDEDGSRVVLANCQAGSAFYLAGFPAPPATNGAAPVVEHPVPAETWTFTGSGEMVNGYSGLALTDPGNGGPGTRLRAGGGSQWKAVGCTAPFDGMPAGDLDWCLNG